MGRRWYLWPVYVLQNLQGLALVAVLLIGGLFLVIKNLLGPALNPSRAALGLLMCVAPALAFRWIYRRNSRKDAEALAAINPLKLSFTAEGIRTAEKSGATSFAPWSCFKGYREGKTIFLLQETNQPTFRAIPKGGLSEIRVEQMRSAIKSSLPDLD